MNGGNDHTVDTEGSIYRGFLSILIKLSPTSPSSPLIKFKTARERKRSFLALPLFLQVVFQVPFFFLVFGYGNAHESQIYFVPFASFNFLALKEIMGTTVGGKTSLFSIFPPPPHHHLLIFSALLLILQRAALVSCTTLNYTNYRRVGSLRLERIQRHLDRINKPPVLTIASPDGDIIDCVHKRKQPALDHPLLKNHKIQKAPTMPKGLMNVKKNIDEKGSERGERDAWEWQTWHGNGTRCPKGTVPIRRSTVHDVLRAKSLFHFGKKQPRMIPLSRRIDAPDVVTGNGHEHAIAYTGTSEEVYGAKATINVWEPSIQVVNEFSLSQIWILSGSFDGSDLNSIEAGWQSDSYQATGCYNLLCSGFVQTHSRIAIGAAISPVSSYASTQYDITILIWKDPKVGNWWMSFGDHTLVGYWPAELFTHLSDHATMVEWGGEVVNTRANGQHSSTQMGSGHFADDGFGKASYFRNLEIVDIDNSLRSVQNILTLAENTNCYDIKSYYSNQWGTYFYYGGPGKNPECP